MRNVQGWRAARAPMSYLIVGSICFLFGILVGWLVFDPEDE